MQKIGIIGGGMLGMTLALRLAEKGFRVSLIEKNSSLGGLVSPCDIGNYSWDMFYHVILLSDTHLLDLLDNLDLTNKISWGFTKTGFFTDGHLYSMSNIVEFFKFPSLNFINKIRLGFTIFYASKIKSWQRLENILSKDWLIKLSGKKTFNKIWLPLLKSKLGENYKKANAVFIWAIIARMYAARRIGLKKEMFGYVDGGYKTIIEKYQNLLDNKGIEILCQHSVNKIVKITHGAELEFTSGKNMKFDKIILTIPCAQIPSLCSQLSLSESQRFSDVTYQGIICASLILKKPLANYYITNITDDWIPFTGVIEMTALVNKEQFDGNSLIYLPCYLTLEDPLWRKNDEEIKDKFINTLERMYPSFSKDDILYFKLSKVNQFLPITTLNYSTELLPSTKTSFDDIFIVNSAQIVNGTLNVNEIIGIANKKALELITLFLQGK